MGTINEFKVQSKYELAGDQPQAVSRLVEGIQQGKKFQTLMGVTGSGKTFTMANVIEKIGKPALIISHNKTLAAQLYEEFKDLFPDNAVEYFVSYYDYYQPEAYIPQRDIYIEKDASRNDDLDRLRLSTTTNLMSRKDVIVIASVSCIFGLGSPEDYKHAVVAVSVGDCIDRNDLLGDLTEIQYERNDIGFQRGKIRARGDVLEVWPSYESYAIRIEFFGDEIERISYINPINSEELAVEQQVFVFPAKHYVMPADRIEAATVSIKEELDQRLMALRQDGKLLEAQRLQARTMYDIEMIQEVGYCSGIENYARYLSGQKAGARPYTLMDYFGDDFMIFIDESHVTIPQIRAMHAGDRSRKQVLVDHGFRLPSAMDNRPLRFDEFEELWKKIVFVTATPHDFELEKCDGEVVEQVIRPTGLLDPEIFVHPASQQVQHLLGAIKERIEAGQRVLVTALTKRLSEDLASYISKQGFKCKYLHSEIVTLERVEILRDLREGKFNVLVGVNLLREGLDLPEVSLVAILDADKEGFLRSHRALVQTIGRAARHVDATVYLYADRITDSMRSAMDETSRRREVQMAYNKEHGITPKTIEKEIRSGMEIKLKARKIAQQAIHLDEDEYESVEVIAQMEKEMLEAAEALDFEKAAALRDRIEELKEIK